jgi:hypothetical protein
MAGGEGFAAGGAAACTEGVEDVEGVTAVITVCFACVLDLLLDVTCSVVGKLREAVACSLKGFAEASQCNCIIELFNTSASFTAQVDATNVPALQAATYNLAV